MKNIRTYLFGFVLSLTLTVGGFALVAAHVASEHAFISHELAMTLLVAFAITQLIVQLTLFLHVGDEPKPKWNLMALAFAIVVVTILVGGTLWIMTNLSHMAGHSELPFAGSEINPQTEND